MDADIEDAKILQPIVMSITVDVVDLLFGSKFPANRHFHHMPMNILPLSVDRYPKVATLRRRLPTSVIVALAAAMDSLA